MSAFDKTARLRARRVFRHRRKQVESAAFLAEAGFERNLTKRLGRLIAVRRFVVGWISLVILLTVVVVMQTIALSGTYLQTKPVAGGTYTEGIIGSYNNANPIYASGAVDTAVSRLIFSSLFTYDDRNQLTGDLAESYSIDDTGRLYTITLRPGLAWQDGAPLTANDVLFTYKLIQNPDANSPLFSSWQGITVRAPNSRTVTFQLPNALSAFPYSLTNGIVPQHLLGKIEPAGLRNNPFNSTELVGSGPFSLQRVDVSRPGDPEALSSVVSMTANPRYHQGKPQLNGFVVRSYAASDRMVRAFQNRTLNAMSGLDNVPDNVSHLGSTVVSDFPTSAAVMTFFKTSNPVLADVNVRQALVKGADQTAVIQALGYPARPVREPLLQGQLGYDPQYRQAATDQTAAKAQLEAGGWVIGADGIRAKGGQRLTFQLFARDTVENRTTVNLLAKQWKAIGVEAIPAIQSDGDFQSTLEFHSYDALLYGISIGNDPDVFAYWDSTQADPRANPRLNFSEYKSSAADAALESGRTRTDPALRVIKYKPFLQAWQADAPALGLYQPRYLYISRGTVYGLTDQVHVLNNDANRYDNVQDWRILTARVSD